MSIPAVLLLLVLSFWLQEQNISIDLRVSAAVAKVNTECASTH